MQKADAMIYSSSTLYPYWTLCWTDGKGGPHRLCGRVKSRSFSACRARSKHQNHMSEKSSAGPSPPNGLKVAWDQETCWRHGAALQGRSIENQMLDGRMGSTKMRWPAWLAAGNLYTVDYKVEIRESYTHARTSSFSALPPSLSHFPQPPPLLTFPSIVKS